MDFLYYTSPVLIAALTALSIAAYSWHRYSLASVVVLGWGAAAIILGQLTFFDGLLVWLPSDWPYFIAFALLAFTPAALLVVAAARSRKFKTFLENVPIRILLLTQISRIGGIALIAAYLRGELPAHIGLISGGIDIAVAISAFALAYYYPKGNAPVLGVAWASVSLLDFMWAVSIVTASFLGFIAVVPAPALMGAPPLLVISLFALPLGIFVSIEVLRRSWTKALRPQ